MRHILFLFLDGVGLGDDEPNNNPFARANLKTLHSLLDGKKLLRDTPEHDNGRARFVPTDAGMGVSGPPQSASGQAAILTGLNVPQLIGGHWGPKPNQAVTEILKRENVFKSLVTQGKSAALINAYPQRYFEAIKRGKRMYSAIPMAVAAANIPLMTITATSRILITRTTRKIKSPRLLSAAVAPSSVTASVISAASRQRS